MAWYALQSWRTHLIEFCNAVQCCGAGVPSQETYLWKSDRQKTTTDFTPGHCGVPGQFINRTSLRVQSGTRKSSSGIYARGQKKRPYPRVEETKWLHRNKWTDKAQILASHFETVFTRESSLSEVVPQSRTDFAKICMSRSHVVT